MLEAKVNASTMRFGSNNDGSHDIKVFKLAVMDGEGERSILISHESGNVVALNEEVITSTATHSSPSSSLCIRGVDGGVAHGWWQPASIYALGRMRAAGGRGKGAIYKRINTNFTIISTHFFGSYPYYTK